MKIDKQETRVMTKGRGRRRAESLRRFLSFHVLLRRTTTLSPVSANNKFRCFALSRVTCFVQSHGKVTNQTKKNNYCYIYFPVYQILTMKRILNVTLSNFMNTLKTTNMSFFSKYMYFDKTSILIKLHLTRKP